MYSITLGFATIELAQTMLSWLGLALSKKTIRFFTNALGAASTIQKRSIEMNSFSSRCTLQEVRAPLLDLDLELLRVHAQLPFCTVRGHPLDSHPGIGAIMCTSTLTCTYTCTDARRFILEYEIHRYKERECQRKKE